MLFLLAACLIDVGTSCIFWSARQQLAHFQALDGSSLFHAYSCVSCFFVSHDSNLMDPIHRSISSYRSSLHPFRGHKARLTWQNHIIHSPVPSYIDQPSLALSNPTSSPSLTTLILATEHNNKLSNHIQYAITSAPHSLSISPKSIPHSLPIDPAPNNHGPQFPLIHRVKLLNFSHFSEP